MYQRRDWKVFKQLVFVVKEKSEDVEESSEYIRDCGFDSFILVDLFDEFFFPEDFMRRDALIVTDSPKRAEEFIKKGMFAVGMLHDSGENVEFPGVKYVFSDINQVDIDSFIKVYQRYSGEPWIILVTKRLLVRETTLEDVDTFYELYKDPEMTRYMEGLFDDPEDEKRYQRDYIKKVYGLMGFGVWTLVRLEDSKVIGRAGYSIRSGFDDIELGFLVGKEYQRHGYAYEACRAILDYGRDMLQFDKVQTLVKAENTVSIHLCERLGFKKTEEVDVEENIYGSAYREGQKAHTSGKATYGKYIRMTMNF